jgi:hypothetical protein
VLSVKPLGRAGTEEKFTVGRNPLLSTTVGAVTEAAVLCKKVKEV